MKAMQVRKQYCLTLASVALGSAILSTHAQSAADIERDVLQLLQERCSDCLATCIVANQRVATAADEAQTDEPQLNLKRAFE
jgi:hypothetical protein